MRIPRIYYSGSLKPDNSISLEKEISHYITRVLRLRENAELTIFNGYEGEYKAHVLEVKRDQVVVKIGNLIANLIRPSLIIHLFQGISRGEKMDFTIQKAVELGVSQITPLLTDFCDVKLKEDRLSKRMTHWQSVIVSACEQSGRNDMPIINEPVSFLEGLETSTKTSARFICDPQGETTFTHTAKNNHIIVFVGPEGGFSNNEIKIAKNFGFQSIKLGPRILRTETAAVVAIASLQCLWGDIG